MNTDYIFAWLLLLPGVGGPIWMYLKHRNRTWPTVLKGLRENDNFAIYKLIEKATFKQMLKSVHKNLDLISIKDIYDEESVRIFISNNSDLFVIKKHSFLLFTNGRKRSVAIVKNLGTKYNVDIYSFKYDVPFYPRAGINVIIPNYFNDN